MGLFYSREDRVQARPARIDRLTGSHRPNLVPHPLFASFIGAAVEQSRLV